jgi:hypothetical protein
MTILERIRQDHDTLRTLLAKAEKEQGKSAFEQLQRELWAHAKAEETIFYAALNRAKTARMETVEGLNEHHMINNLVDELNAMPAEGVSWRAKLQVLGELVRHHLDEEEEEMFEEAEKLLDKKRSTELGDLYLDRKEHALAALEPLPKG